MVCLKHLLYSVLNYFKHLPNSTFQLFSLEIILNHTLSSSIFGHFRGYVVAYFEKLEFLEFLDLDGPYFELKYEDSSKS